MKYYIKAREEELWTMGYVIEADSGDEAKEKYLNNSCDCELVDDIFEEISYREILEIEPYNE